MKNSDMKIVGALFGAREEAKSELERELGLTLKDENGIPSDIGAYDGFFVEVLIDENRYGGVIKGITQDGGYVLKPTVHRKPDSFMQTPNRQLTAIEANRWEDKAKIAYGSLREISKMDEDVLRAVADDFESVKHLGKYVSSVTTKKNLLCNVDDSLND